MSKIKITIEIDDCDVKITSKYDGKKCSTAMTRCNGGWKGTRKADIVDKEREAVFGDNYEIESAIDNMESAAMDIARELLEDI